MLLLLELPLELLFLLLLLLLLLLPLLRGFNHALLQGASPHELRNKYMQQKQQH